MVGLAIWDCDLLMRTVVRRGGLIRRKSIGIVQMQDLDEPSYRDQDVAERTAAPDGQVLK